MEKDEKHIKSNRDVLKIEGVIITSNINEPLVREHVTKCICEMTQLFYEKYKDVH